MKSAPIFIPMAVAAVLAVFAAAPKDSATAGKDLFLQYKCNSCHTLKAHAIVKQADAEEEEAKEGDRKPPDLSGAGKKRTAEWIGKYMLKTVDNDGEKHRKKFKGTEAELKTLAAWLESLKGEKKAAK